jgi:arginine decarboxylase
VLLTPYPPGIPLLIPGERFNRTIVGYLQFARRFNQQFPGFETDIHGLVVQKSGAELHYFVDCVRLDSRDFAPADIATHQLPLEVQPTITAK